MSEQNYKKVGYLAHKWGHVVAPLAILRSRAGWFLGTEGEFGPGSRESDYFSSPAAAEEALNSGCWAQRPNP